MWAIMCVCHHVCHTQRRSCLSTGWALNRCFAWFFGTVAVLAQGGGGGVDMILTASGCVDKMSCIIDTRCPALYQHLNATL